VISSRDLPAETILYYARAIHLSSSKLPEEVATLPVRFNTYVRPLEDARLQIWYLPAWQTDGTMIYGGELCFTLNETGTEVLGTDHDYTRFYGAMPDPEVDLMVLREENDVPSVGDVFFLILAREEFKSVTIRNRTSNTLLMEHEGEEFWVTVEREDDKKLEE
jgi:hypothetical protein